LSSFLGRRYRFGASFVDPFSGVRFEGHNPIERPDLWELYLTEAEGKYRSHGFEGTLRRQELQEGQGVPLFFLGFDESGAPVAGVRFHGPLEGSFQAAILEEMAASPDIDEIRALIDHEIRHGAIEVKGAWSKGAAAVGVRLVASISRSVTHAMTWLGAEYAIAAVSDTLMPMGIPTGARQIGENWVPFPDERYRTVAVNWRRARSMELCAPEHQQALRQESEQLLRGPSRTETGVEEGPTSRTHSFKPLVIDVSSRSQREVLRILREDPSLTVIDRLEEQRSQLASVLPPPPATVTDESARWIYYPWRKAVVRLLGARSFSLVRLDRNRNKITKAEQAKLRGLVVGVVGQSTGHTIAHALAMEGLAGEIRLADFDTLDLSNLNRLPAGVLDLGLNKAVIAARRIAELDPYLRTVVLREGVTLENLDAFLEGLDVVIEECDSLDMKVKVREAARERRIPVIMETSDRGVLDVERFDLEPDRPIFHGLLGDLDSTKLAGLTMAEKAPYLIRLVGPKEASSRGAASMLEVGVSITGWPQLASEVTLGAATAAAAIRRLGLNGELPSGRVRFDIEEILEGLGPVDVDLEAEADLFVPPPADPPTTSDDPVDIIVDAARRAPSGGNVQPWRFEADASEVRFFMVPERTSKMDVAHRGTYVGLGAALFNARVAASSLHKLGPVRLFPDGRSSHHVATMLLGETHDVTLERFGDLLIERATNRKIAPPTGPVDPEIVAELGREVEREGARLHWVGEASGLVECAEILAQSDRLRFLIPDVHQQMLTELRWPGRDALDEGLDVRTLEMDPTGYAVMDIMARPDVMAHLAEWRGGQVLGMRTRAAIQISSGLALVTIPRPEAAWYVRGGAAVERLWLAAHARGLALQPSSPVFLYAQDETELADLSGERYLDETHALRTRFDDFFGLADGECAAMLLRVFRADAPSVHSIRLPLNQVLSRDGTPSNDSHPTPLRNW
jgi:nitroreductase